MPQLVGLPNVRRAMDAVNIRSPRDIKRIIAAKKGATTAADHGAITFWRDDSGILRGDLQRYCVTVESATFRSYRDILPVAERWLKLIREGTDVLASDTPPPNEAPPPRSTGQ